MDNRLIEHLNQQINFEFYSAYLYLAMSTYFSEINMDGFAKFMKSQAKEELEHAQKIYDYLLLRNEKISYQRIEAPDTDWVNAQDVLDEAIEHEKMISTIEHEKMISTKIHELYKIAKESDDFATMNFLNWFVEEQLEEEEKFRVLREKIKAFDECACTLEAMDRELNKD